MFKMKKSEKELKGTVAEGMPEAIKESGLKKFGKAAKKAATSKAAFLLYGAVAAKVIISSVTEEKGNSAAAEELADKIDGLLDALNGVSNTEAELNELDRLESETVDEAQAEEPDNEE